MVSNGMDVNTVPITVPELDISISDMVISDIVRFFWVFVLVDPGITMLDNLPSRIPIPSSLVLSIPVPIKDFSIYFFNFPVVNLLNFSVVLNKIKRASMVAGKGILKRVFVQDVPNDVIKDIILLPPVVAFIKEAEGTASVSVFSSFYSIIIIHFSGVCFSRRIFKKSIIQEVFCIIALFN